MDISELKKYSELMSKNKALILKKWLSFETVINTLKNYIDTKKFGDDYARHILDYYFDVIDDKKEIGNCPIMNHFLETYSGADKHIPVHELYTICTNMRLALIDFTFEHNIASKSLFDQINYIVDSNIIGVMQRYKHIIDAKTQQINEQTLMIKQYNDAIDRFTIISKTDTKGKITFANDNFCEISGYTKEELMGQAHSIVRHEDSSAETFKELWLKIQSKKTWDGILKNYSKDGRTYYVNTIIFPILNTDNEIVEYMSIRHDLTELFELHLEIETTQEEIIYKMGEIGETRSEETGYHVKRVAEYSRLLAEHLGLDKKEIRTLVSASPMHDIGKVGIPDSILKKAGKLTEDEWRIMQTHAAVGHKILCTSERPILKAAATISLHHHEKFNGEGYPNGLKADEIHIYGRITAVADVFDALGSDRVYKEAWPLERVLEYFKKQRGQQFDPVLVDILLNNIDDFLKIKNSFVDVFLEKHL